MWYRLTMHLRKRVLVVVVAAAAAATAFVGQAWAANHRHPHRTHRGVSHGRSNNDGNKATAKGLRH
jgi:hypothetical protein